MLKQEWIKSFSCKIGVLVIVIVLFLNIMVVMSIDSNDEVNWRENAIRAKNISAGAVASSEKGNYHSYYEENAIIDYSLENDIPYNVRDFLDHSESMTEFFGVITVLFIFFVGNIFVKEYSCGTWKNLLLTGKSITHIYVSKVCFAYVCAIGVLAWYMFLSLLIGLIVYGPQDYGVKLVVYNGNVVEMNKYVSLLGKYMIFSLKLLMYIGLTMTIAILLNGKNISFLIPCIIALISTVIDKYVKGTFLRTVLPFSYLNETSFDMDRIWRMMLVMGVYTGVFWLVGWWKIKNSELA